VFADEVVKTHLRDIWNSTEQDVLAAWTASLKKYFIYLFYMFFLCVLFCTNEWIYSIAIKQPS
jgi:hypothetical protein